MPLVENPRAQTRNTPVSDDDSVFVFPATLAQRRLWLLEQFQANGSPALNMPIALRWRGPLDLALFNDALDHLVARHEALRTAFQSERGELHQIVHPVLHVGFSISEAAGALDELIAKETGQRFDLENGPAFRAALIRLAKDEHVLLFTIHHLVSDGWSNGVLLRDLCAYYTAAIKGNAPALPELPLQFPDYAEWQQTQLLTNAFAADREYWRNALAGELPGIDLPIDHPRRTTANNPGAVRSRIIPAEIASRARSFAAQENASPFMLFLAVFQALLHRYTGQNDFVLTTPSANRERPELESVIGPLANPLLLRSDTAGSPTFRELLRRVRRNALDAFAHQDVPFELLLDEFGASGLQVNFHFDSGLTRRLDLPADVSVEPYPIASTGTVYELSASVLEDAGDLRLHFEYNAALFDHDTVERMLEHFEQLLESALRDADRPVFTIPLLTAAEEPALQDVAGAVAPLELRDLLAESVLAKPDAVAARHGRREMSRAELLVRLEIAQRPEAPLPSDLTQIAAWVAHWRARLDTPPPEAAAHPDEIEAALAAAARILRDVARLGPADRIASYSPPGFAATEEIGAALLANVPIVYAIPALIEDSAMALAAWLEAENITVAFFAAATWHRVAAAIVARKTRKPTKLRMVVVTEGEPREGSFGRVGQAAREVEGVQICRRVVLEAAGGTIAIDDNVLPKSSRRLRAIDRKTGAPLPIGIPGELAIVDRSGVPRPTGELARLLANGAIDRLGPIGEQRYARGFRLDSRLTEDALSQVPGVRHAVVRPMNAGDDAALTGYILHDAAKAPLPGDAAVRQSLRQQGLSAVPVPQQFVVLKDIPLRSDEGALDLHALATSAGAPLPGTSEPVRPYLGLQLQLIAIWEEVLGVPGIGIRDDFFELGGNSLLAMRMLQRAEVACGKAISATALFHQPTIEGFAAEIAREARDESPSLLRVHDAGTRTPFFYLHGDLSGGGFYSLKLSRSLGADQPFYVLPPQDIRTLPATPTIEGMAMEHSRALRAVRPHGPYVIGGFCIGGLIAYEVAQQLKAAGEKIEMLLIIDAAPDRMLRALRWCADVFGSLFRWDEEARLAHFGSWAILHARLAMRLAARRAKTPRQRRSIAERAARTLRFVRRRLHLESPQKAKDGTVTLQAEPDLPAAFRWASASYRPRLYTGPITLLLSEDVLTASGRILRSWQQLAPNVKVEPLRGSHLECITEHVEELAQTIELSLRSMPHQQ